MPACLSDPRALVLVGCLAFLLAVPVSAQGGFAHVSAPASVQRIGTRAAQGSGLPAPTLGLRDNHLPETVGCAPRTLLMACDGWTGPDKLKHTIFAFSLTASTYYLVKNTTNLSRSQSLLLSFGTMTAVGLTKEWLDWENDQKRCFSAGDMAANGVGMLLAAGFVLAF